jgi:hypothetical protein
MEKNLVEKWALKHRFSDAGMIYTAVRNKGGNISYTTVYGWFTTGKVGHGAAVFSMIALFPDFKECVR